jgi:hypothetical protein
MSERYTKLVLVYQQLANEWIYIILQLQLETHSIHCLFVWSQIDSGVQ